MAFASKWIKENKDNNVKDKIDGPIKPRIEMAQKRLQMQIAALDAILQKLKSKDQLIFNKIIAAIQKRDTQYSTMLANELAQIRKTIKMVSSSKLALEQIHMRLSTITDLGDVVVTLTPAMSVIKNVRAGLSNMMPEVDKDMNEISNVLGSILVDAGQVGGYTINFDYANEEAARIMEEAAAIAESSIEEKLPTIPSMMDKKMVSSNYE